MNKQRKTSHILNVFQYDANGHVGLPASLTLGIAPAGDDNSGKVPTTAWVRSIVGGAVTAYAPTSRTITINGTSYDLSSNRAWSIDTGVLTATAGSGISVSVVNQNLNIVNTGILTATAGSGISVSTVNQNLNIVNTGILTASAGLGISLSVVGQNLNVVNTGILTATAGAGISLSVVNGNLNVVNTITNNNQLTNGAGYITSSALTGYATETYVGTAISNLVAAAPTTLDTLNELAAALGNDPNFATTISTALGNRLRVDINTQGLSATLQGYGRTNLGLGTAATSNTGDFVAYRTFGTAANSAIGDFVAYRTFGTAANNNTGDFALASHTHSIANVTGLQTALDGKQASGSYAASSHSHIISDVTGLQTALDGKQASLSGTGFVKISGTTISYDNSTYLTTASATSTYLPLAGGTLTGGLTGTSATFSGSVQLSSSGSTISTTYGGITTIYLLVDTGGGILKVDGDNTIRIVTNNVNRFQVNSTAATFTIPLSGTSSTFSGNIALGTTPASAAAGAVIRLPFDNAIRWRNSGNTGDIGLYVGTSNLFQFDSGINVAGAATFSSSATFGSYVSVGNTSGLTKLNVNNAVSGAILPYIQGTGLSYNSEGISVAGSNTNNTNIGNGITFYNNVASVGAYGPVISWSSMTVGGAYNATYAFITGVYRGAGGDNNWAVGDIIFGTGNSYGASERMRIKDTGNVGIGTTSPNYPLHVYKSSGTSAINVESVSGQNSQYRLEEAGVIKFAITYVPSDSSTRMYFAGHGTDLITLKASTVLIATTISSGYGVLNTYKAPVSSNFVDQIVVQGAGNYPSLRLGTYDQYDGVIATTGNDLRILSGLNVTTENHNIMFYTSFVGGTTGAQSYERLRIAYNGNVGIGTAGVPQGLLDVYKSTSGGLGGHIMLRNNGAAVGNEMAVMFVDGDSTTMRAAISSTTEGSPYFGDLKFKTGLSAYGSLTTRMIITGAGNVGVGTLIPEVSFVVKGVGIGNGGKASFYGGGDENNWSANNNEAIRIGRADILNAYYSSIWSSSGSSPTESLHWLKFYISNGSNAQTLACTMFGSGNVSVAGALSKGSGSFRIEHPLESLSSTHELVHSFIEGPKADLIYRGKLTLINGKAEANIDQVSNMTEGTFEVLCREVQCFTTNETGWDLVKGKVIGNIIYIESQNQDSTDEISWMVIGERKDKHMIDTDWTDDNGKVIVEPLKQINISENN